MIEKQTLLSALHQFPPPKLTLSNQKRYLVSFWVAQASAKLGSSAHRLRRTREYKADRSKYQNKEPTKNRLLSNAVPPIASNGDRVTMAKINIPKHSQPNRLTNATAQTQVGIASAKALNQELGEGNQIKGFLVTTGIKPIMPRTIRKIKNIKP